MRRAAVLGRPVTSERVPAIKLLLLPKDTNALPSDAQVIGAVQGGTFGLGFNTLPVVFAHMGAFGNIIGRSRGMQRVYKLIGQIAPTDLTVTGGTVQENAPAGTVVATLGATDDERQL